MKLTLSLFAGLLLALQIAATAQETLKVPVDSTAFVFSPGNWIGDTGRTGKAFRQTWNSGAYFRVRWESDNPRPAAKLLLDTSTYPPGFKPPEIAYNIDGVWKAKVSCQSEIGISEISGAGKHELCVYLCQSQQKERWGSEGKSGLNVFRVTGLEIDASSKPIACAPDPKWALIVGDSITEGIGATEMACYSTLTGQALRSLGYEYGISACGWSGWLNKGDNPPGDVPGYYAFKHPNGAARQYDDAASRWNKLDGNGHSLLDDKGRLSGYGSEGQEPALIMINYGTNDALHHSDPADTKASINECLVALRKSAPNAEIIIIIPFGQYDAAFLKDAVKSRQSAMPPDKKLSIIDLGPGVAKSLSVKDGLLGGLHPNDRGNALFAASIIAQTVEILTGR